jgi:hypothetical protein
MPETSAKIFIGGAPVTQPLNVIAWVSINGESAYTAMVPATQTR